MSESFRHWRCESFRHKLLIKSGSSCTNTSSEKEFRAKGYLCSWLSRRVSPTILSDPLHYGVNNQCTSPIKLAKPPVHLLLDCVISIKIIVVSLLWVKCTGPSTTKGDTGMQTNMRPQWYCTAATHQMSNMAEAGKKTWNTSNCLVW